MGVTYISFPHFFFRPRSDIYLQFLQELTAPGKNGANGPIATPHARVPENSATEPVQLPCSEAATVLATQLRRRHVLRLDWSLLINHLVKTPPIQVNLDVLYWF